MRHSIGEHLRHRSESLKSNRSSTDESLEPAGDDTTVVEPEQGNVLSHIISQLRPGADLSRVTLPTFILEERSMLERITNFMAHPETLLKMPDIEDPLQRFVAVVGYYLSGWHIRPPGVKKPLNPILGEVFTGYWDYPDGTQGYYISEQTSHHPPKSSYFFIAPEHHVRVDGTLKPRSRFLGNSAASLMEGISYLRFTNRGKSPGGEKYILTQPNMYARGILFGKMKYELGDHAFVRCPENNLSADIEFKVKGWVAGTYNAIGGFIKNDKTGENLYELSGLWSGEMFIKDLKTGQKKPLFDATHAKHSPPKARPFDEQGERESQRLWREVCKAVHVMDHEKATTEKSKIEDRQREEAKQREEKGQEWRPKLFKKIDPAVREDDLEWVLDADIDPKGDPKSIIEQVLAIAPILPGQAAAAPNSKPSSPVATRAPAQAPVQAPAPAPAPASATTQTQNTKPESLIDFEPVTASDKPRVDATPKSKPIEGNSINSTPQAQPSGPVHQQTTMTQPTSNPALSRNLLDDDTGLSGKMEQLKVQQPAKPAVIERTDTETSEVDVFVDAQG